MNSFFLEIPHITGETIPFTLNVTDTSILKSRKHILRFDLYPKAAPSPGHRHYGWWDIPLAHIDRNRVEMRLDLKSKSLLFENRNKTVEVGSGLRRSVDETGYSTFHTTLLDTESERPYVVETKPYHLYIAGNRIEPMLKQINIPVTDRCNLSCPNCPRSHSKDLIAADIADEVLKPLLDSVGDIHCVLLQGLGEPLLYPGMIDLIREVKRLLPKYGEAGLTTNATLLDEQYVARLLDTGIDFIYFSVDAATDETYRKVRRGGNFRTVMENIAAVTRYREVAGLKKTKCMLNFVMMPENIDEIPAFAQMCATLGVENLTYSYCLIAGTGKMITFDSELLRTRFEEAKKIGGAHGIQIFFPPLQESRKPRCLFMECAIPCHTGDVYPCHAMAPGYGIEGQVKIFGNVKDMPLRRIWEKPEYREFRRRVVSGDFPSECSQCECKSYLVP